MSVHHPYPQARLAEHVRACVVGDQMIFLDLRRNKYIGVGGPQLPALSASIFGRSVPEDAPVPVAGEWLGRLRQQQLLSDETPNAPAPLSPALPEPTAGLTIDDDARDLEWRDLVRLWRATLVTSAWLRRHSLADIADRVTGLRSRHLNRGERLAADALPEAARAYAHLRPFALTAHDRCLHDSLALIHFLASLGMFPRWVVGVRVHPFGAHSWVQSGGLVLNDQPERVRHYRPILVV